VRVVSVSSFPDFSDVERGNCSKRGLGRDKGRASSGLGRSEQFPVGRFDEPGTRRGSNWAGGGREGQRVVKGHVRHRTSSFLNGQSFRASTGGEEILGSGEKPNGTNKSHCLRWTRQGGGGGGKRLSGRIRESAGGGLIKTLSCISPNTRTPRHRTYKNLSSIRVKSCP